MENKDRFIEERLDILNDTNGLDYNPPDRTEKNREIAEHFAVSLKKQNNSTKTEVKCNRKFLMSFAAGAMSMIVLGVFIFVSIFNSNENFYYDDDKLINEQCDIMDLQNNFEFLLPEVDSYTIASVTLFKGQDTNENVYVHLRYVNSVTNDKMELKIIFVDNYSLLNQAVYDSLIQSGQSNMFEFKYNIIGEVSTAHAKFTYNNYRYYLMLTSDTPQNIINIIESFN